MFYGSSTDRYSDFVEDSTSHKLKNAYWSTKQAAIRKFGKEEDKHVVASDFELDGKLALFRSVQMTCNDLIICIERYLRCIYGLSQAENEMGRFLKQKSEDDKTRAGKMLAAVGKSLSHSAKQRITLKNPLSRLDQEVQTFRNRAIGDTALTIQRMETARTEYRGALLWMKNVSDELDPDMYKKLDKFRRVQTQVRKSKSIFDRLKVASMQKVDLLAASRCNMLSQVLAAYQDTLLQFWERTARTMTTVADSFKGYQHYEFALLKELTPETIKLSEQTSGTFSDEAASESSEKCEVLDNMPTEEEIDRNLDSLFTTNNSLLDVDPSAKNFEDLLQSLSKGGIDGDNNPQFLDDILSPTPTSIPEGDKKNAHHDLSNLFFSQSDQAQQNPDASFFNVNWDSKMIQLPNMTKNVNSYAKPSGSSMSTFNSQAGLKNYQPSRLASTAVSLDTKGQNKDFVRPPPENLDAWMNFFADLTPIGNPDQKSKLSGHVLDA